MTARLLTHLGCEQRDLSLLPRRMCGDFPRTTRRPGRHSYRTPQGQARRAD